MPNTSDIIFDTLEQWGVDTVFGLPGDGINGLMETLRKRQSSIRFVLVRHEEAAAFAASGYAKLTGKLGVCLATTGPGAVHLLNGLYDAKMDNMPVLALTGLTYSDLEGSQYQQDVNTERLMSDVATYDVRVNSPEHASLAVDLAVKNALARNQPAHVTVPVDVQVEEYQGDYTKHRATRQTSRTPVRPATVPPLDQLKAAAEVVNAADRPLILAGAGARGGAKELAAFAEHLQAPVIKALLGKDILPDDHPLSLGGLGLLGTKPASEAMEETDCVILVGTNFPYAEFLPDGRVAHGIQIDVDATKVGSRFPVDVGLIGDARATLQALQPHVERRGESKWVQQHQQGMQDWWHLMEDRASRRATPVKPQMVAWELGKRLDDDAILCGDSGTNTTWLARYVKIRGTQRFTLSGMLASMGSALPYATAAATAYPDRQVVAFLGDGAMQMLMGELGTIRQHDLNVKIVVIRNDQLGMIRWEQMVFLGNPSYGVQFPPVNYALVAEAFGIKSWRVEAPDEVEPTLDAFLAHEGPAFLEAVVDPNEPPHPPQVKLEQATHMAEALARGEPNSTRVGLTLFRDKVRDLFRTDAVERERPREEPPRR